MFFGSHEWEIGTFVSRIWESVIPGFGNGRGISGIHDGSIIFY